MQPHVVVIGAGVIGLSAAYHLVKAGARVTIVDRDPAGDRASLGNAGAIAVTEVVPAATPGVLWRVPKWMLDPLGPLAVRPAHAPKLLPWLSRFARVSAGGEVERISAALAALTTRVYDDLVPMLADVGLTSDLHRTGALSVYESEDGFRRDSAEWALKRSHGISTQELSGDEAREMEPSLGPIVCRAVLTPQWSRVSDPKRIVQGLDEWLRSQSVTISQADVRDVRPGSKSMLVVDGSGNVTEAEFVVVAAGAWSGALARRMGDRVLLESERGYNQTIPNAGITLRHQLIFAERKFVAGSLSCGLRIGGAAEFAGLSAAPNFKRSEALVKLARRYLPALQTEGGRSWAGHRPATPDSLPVIGRSARDSRVLYAFGHGHLGLTLAATTGRLVADLAFERPSGIDLKPYGAERFRT